MNENKRLTPEELRMLEMITLVPAPEGEGFPENEVPLVSHLVQKLCSEVRALGGPVCINCKKNQARYTTDRCALCDLELPPEERGERGQL